MQQWRHPVNGFRDMVSFIWSVADLAASVLRDLPLPAPRREGRTP